MPYAKVSDFKYCPSHWIFPADPNIISGPVFEGQVRYPPEPYPSQTKPPKAIPPIMFALSIYPVITSSSWLFDLDCLNNYQQYLTTFIITEGLYKGMDLRDVSREELAFVMGQLNNRPRKTLAFKPPHDIFVKSESNGFARVALGS